MKKASYLCVVTLVLFIFYIPSRAQDKAPGLDNYMQTGKTIFIAKCVKVGPVNILLRAEVDLEVIHVVKGPKLPGEISVISQFGMETGKTYLLRSEDELTKPERHLFLKTRDSVIPIGKYEDMAKLLSLPPKIIVLRTMNIRVDHLQNKIRALSYEMEALKAARIE